MAGLYLAYKRKPVLPRLRWSPRLKGWLIVNWNEMFLYSQQLTYDGRKTYLTFYIEPASNFKRIPNHGED